MNAVARRVRAVLPPIVFGALFLAAWEAFVTWRDIKPFVLVKPSKVWSAGLDNLQRIADAMEVTGTNALIGLVAGTLLGCLVALLAAGVRWVGELVNPVAAAVNAIPIVVLIALFTRLYEADSETPRRIMSTLAAFFVVFINVSRGLRQSSPTQLELMRSFAASPRQQFVKVRLPNAMSFLFTGIRVAAPLTVITAVVAEYFGGSQNGLGSRITSNVANSRNAVAWAYVLGACVLGLTFYMISIALERVSTHNRGIAPRGA